MAIKQYIVDAFTDQVFKGNPAAVCKLQHWLPDTLLQAIAAENNLSETAFAVQVGDHYKLRYFTPTAEIDFCGHATLATAFVLTNFLQTGAENVMLRTAIGEIEVKTNGEVLTMYFPAYELNEIGVTPAMSAALGVMPKGAWLDRDLLLLLDSAEQVKKLQPEQALLKTLPGLTIAVTAPADDSYYDCVSRVFAPELGIMEDPVTGSTHGMIAPYWAQVLGKNKIRAYQASSRGGSLLCEVNGPRIMISGTAMLFAIAEIYPQGLKHFREAETVTVHLEPDGVTSQVPRVKTARQLLTTLGLAEETALVIRHGILLTPDRQIWPGDELSVRKVGSRG